MSWFKHRPLKKTPPKKLYPIPPSPTPPLPKEQQNFPGPNIPRTPSAIVTVNKM